MVGVSRLIEVCRLTSDDVFVDVGSGIGNVVAQVALESDVALVVGIEIRRSLATRGASLISRFSTRYARLKHVTIIPEDVCSVDATTEPWLRVSVLFCHNTLFVPHAQLRLEALCCALPKLRLVVLQQSFCHRHSTRCTKEFCMLFLRREEFSVPVTFKSSLNNFVVFERRGFAI